MMMRRSYALTPAEQAEFAMLCRASWRHEGAVWRFWGAVARARGLDYKTIIGNENDRASFSALPLDHGRHWCFPRSLKCSRPASAYPHVVSE